MIPRCHYDVWATRFGSQGGYLREPGRGVARCPIVSFEQGTASGADPTPDHPDVPPVAPAQPEGAAPVPPQGWSPAQPPAWTSPTGYAGQTQTPAPGAIPPHMPPPAFPPAYGAAPPSYPPQYGAWAPPPSAPKPGVVPLRPLGLGDILDGAVTYIRRDPKTVLGLSALLSLALVVLSFVANAAAFSSLSGLSARASTATGSADSLDAVFGASAGASVASQLTSLVGLLASFVVGVIATGLFTSVMGQAVLGRHVTVGQAWERTRARFWPLIGLTLLTFLILAGTAVVAGGGAIALGFVIGSAAGAGLGILIGFILVVAAICLFVWLAIRFSLAPAAVVLEKARPVMSLRRSVRLVKGAWWRVFGIALLAQIIASVVGGVLAIPFTVIGGLTSINSLESGNIPWTYLLAVGIGTFVSSVITLPFTSGVTSLQYIDQRIRREALDLELQRASGTGDHN